MFEDSYKVVTTPGEGLYKEKGSKFFAEAFQVHSEAEVKAKVAEIKKKYFDAKHHCYAFIIGPDKSCYRSSDDGEPSGTAGKPILNQILSKDLTNVCVVVTRYFGGQLLGVPGLINAYKTSAREALDNCGVMEKTVDEVYSVFGLSYKIELSTMPEDHIGDVKDWDFATETLKEAVMEVGKDFEVNEGDGAFYGPKLDFHLADSLGRTWQCGTVQLDSQLPERFELEYTGEDGQKHRPVMLHRVVLGSIERFIGVITEHFAGASPTWLSPVQVKLLPITDRAAEYADQVAAKLEAAGYRVETDHRNEKIGKKIRDAQLEKVPYMLVIGDKEAEAGNVSVRHRADGDLGVMSTEDFMAQLKELVDTKACK